MVLNRSSVEAPFSIGISTKKGYLAAPPIFLLFADESYHFDEVMIDYVPSFFIEVQGEPI